MATKLYNFTNQKLNAEKLREVQAFNSSNFGGIISNSSPFTVEGNKVTLNAPTTFLGGGVLLSQLENIDITFDNSNTLWYLQVTLDSSVANITTDELIDSSSNSKISFNKKVCGENDYLNIDSTYTYFSPVREAIGNPHENGYYEYNSSENKYIISDDTIVQSSTVYYYKIEASKISFKIDTLSTTTFTYFGNTLWINDNTFIIPLYVGIKDLETGNLVLTQTVVIRDLSDLEGLLSLSAYANLKKYLEENFVWSSGGTEVVGNHKKGDIGNLNVTEDTISNGSAPVKIQSLTIKNLAGSNGIHTKLIVDSDGHISAMHNYITPILYGGTNANNRIDAKENLGIHYGKDVPTKTMFPDAVRGDIYFRIIE